MTTSSRRRKAKFRLGQVVNLAGNYTSISSIHDNDEGLIWYGLERYWNPDPKSHGTYLELELKPLNAIEIGKPSSRERRRRSRARRRIRESFEPQKVGLV